jgi:hypothetical protein
MVTQLAAAPESGTNEDGAALDIDTRVKEFLAAAELDEAGRRRLLRKQMLAELSLPREQLRDVTRARLDALLRIDAQLPPASVERLVASLEAVVDGLPGDLAMRRVEFVQTLTHRLPAERQEQMQHLVPGVLLQRPVSKLSGTLSERPKKRHWWQRG